MRKDGLVTMIPRPQAIFAGSFFGPFIWSFSTFLTRNLRNDEITSFTPQTRIIYKARHLLVFFLIMHIFLPNFVLD